MTVDRYRTELEKLGEDVVRYRISNRMPISDGSDNLPYDEAKAWLAEKAAVRQRAENFRYWTVLVVAVISAIAAIVAALPVVRSWTG